MSNSIGIESYTFKLYLLKDYICEVFANNNNLVIIGEDFRLECIKKSHKEALKAVETIENLLENDEAGPITVLSLNNNY